MFIFVKEGIRKLSDLNTVIGNSTRFILMGGVCLQERAQLSMQELEPQKDRKV